jgi:hypothetical protein
VSGNTLVSVGRRIMSVRCQLTLELPLLRVFKSRDLEILHICTHIYRL